VVLGHNKDDCFENILTNICSCSKYENLTGMQRLSNQEVDKLVMLRPLLKISKKSIVEIAKDCCIPYLYDSTPCWSQRGKIRDCVVPVLDSWNETCIKSFFTLSDRLSEMQKVCDVYIHDILSHAESNSNMNEVKFTISLDIVCMEYIWWLLFKSLYISKDNNILHHIPSKKSIEMLVNRIKTRSKKASSQEIEIINVDLMKNVKIQCTFDIDLCTIIVMKMM
jgi:tRNA(Ile)-lysidine synthase TilS/MesJ